MKKLLFFAFVSFIASCEMENGGSTKANEINDSILFYYTISSDKSLDLNRRQQAVNKSLFFSKKIKRDTFYSQLLYRKSVLHLSLQQYDSLEFFSNHLINHALKINHDFILGRQHYLMGYYFAEVAKNPDSAYFNYNLSKNYFQSIENDNWIGINLLHMGVIQQNHNDYFGSKETITEALQFLNATKDSNYISSAYNELATNHRKLLNYTDAIEYYIKATENTSSVKDKLIYKNNLAATYIDDKQYSNAINLLNAISPDSLLLKNKKEYPRVLDNLAYTQWLSGKTFNRKDFLRPLRIRKQNNDKRGQISSYTHLGEYYAQNNPKRAKLYFDSVVHLSHTLKMPKAEKDVLKHLMIIEPNNIGLKDRYVFLQDSLYEQELKVKTQFAKYKYDDKLKQESILRLEKEKAEKELETQQQRSQKIQAYFGAGFLMLLFGFISYYFKQRDQHLKQANKTAKIEATFETEEELSRKLHDDFGGKLNHTMLLLQNDADTSEVLDVVEGLYNQSRDFSRKINDVDTGPNFKNLLLGMLGTYSKDTKLALTGSTTLDWNNLSELTKKTVYRVLQELMSNMQKYSKATLVSINFGQTKKILKVDYSDNGVGATKDNLNNRNGLWNTEKRIQAIGGTIIFDSEKGKGFNAQIQIPN